MVNKTPKKGLILIEIRFLLPDTRILVTGISDPVDIFRKKINLSKMFTQYTYDQKGKKWKKIFFFSDFLTQKN